MSRSADILNSFLRPVSEPSADSFSGCGINSILTLSEVPGGEHLIRTTSLDRRMGELAVIKPERVTTERNPSFYEVEKSAGTTLVYMDSYNSVAAQPGEKVKIATFGLCGCTATAVVSEYPDGSKRGYIQHFSPAMKSFGESMLRTEVGGAGCGFA